MNINRVGMCLVMTLLCAVTAALFAETGMGRGQTDPFDGSKSPIYIDCCNGNLPQGMRWNKSRVTPDNSHYVWSPQSIRWEWEQGAKLEFSRPIPWKSAAEWRKINPSESYVQNSTFIVWMYNETSMPEKHVTFTFFRGKEKAARFEFNLNFTGWRTIWAGFNHRTGFKGDTDMDRFTIEPPEGVPSGIFWIGDITTSIPLFPNVAYDAQFHPPNGEPLPETQRYQELAAMRHWVPPADFIVTTNAVDDLRRVRKRLWQRLRGDKEIPMDCSFMNDAETRFAAYNIKRTKSGISGKHIFMETANAHVVAAPPGYADHGVAVRFLLQDMKRLAKRYQQTPAESRSTPQLLRAKEIFLLMTEHLLDQGFAEGSDLGTMHHPGYGLRGWIEAVTLMAEELKEAGLYDSSLRALFYYYPAGFSETEEGECWYLMDYLNGHAMQCLMLNLFGDDKVAAAKLYKYSRLLSSQLSAPSLGKLGGIKPDGALFHHGQLYIGYAAGILSASGLFKLLDGTVFELSREAYDKVKKAFLACYVWSEPWSGLAACGRHPVTSRMNRAALIASTAELAVAVPGTSGEDEELAATVMREQPGSDSMELFGVEIRPASKLQGFSAMNYAALGIHKYGDSSVAISGFGKGVSGGETYRNANRYRRYNNQGSIQVFKTTAEHSSGFSQVYGMPGWDWCLTPGTTAMRLPYNVLEGSVSFYGWQPPQDTGPSGAGSLEGRIGAFIFQSDFNTCRPLAQQMRMRKSVFANGSHLICLGSGITATNEIYPVVTTLFQGELPAEDAVMWMGTENGYINLTHSLEGEILLTNTTWIIDAYGTGYMLPRDSRLRMRRGRHVSRDGNTGEATEALMSAVWIKHGINPSGATYRYDIILDAEPQQMADMYRAQSLGITKVDILRRDDAVHAVVFPDRNIEAYVYFEACQNGETFLRSVDRCSIILLRKRVNGSVVMSVTNPLIADLAGTEPVETRLNVAGRWKVARYNPSVCCSPQANNTDLVISPTRGLPVEFVLQKIK